MTARLLGSCLGLSEGPVSMRETVMSQQSVRQAARRSALDAQAVLRKETPVRNWQSTAMAPCSLASLAHGSANAHSSCRVKGFRVRTRRTPSHHRDHAEQAGQVAQDIPVNHSWPPSHPFSSRRSITFVVVAIAWLVR